MNGKFETGKVVMTRGIADRIFSDENFLIFVSASLGRYAKCDWGDMCDEDKMMNDEAVQQGDSRIFAAYINPKTNEKIWIITDADRKYTTIDHV